MADLIIGVVGSITGKIIDKVSESSEREETIRLKEIGGKYQKEIAIINGKNTIDRIQEEGKIKLESQKLDIKREELQNAHNKDMKILDYQHELDMKNSTNKHELDLLKQKDESKKVDAEIERMNQDTIEKNKREMKKLEGELNIATLRLKNEIEISQKEIGLKQTQEQNKHEQAITNINYAHEEKMKKQDIDAEKMRLENNRELKKMDLDYQKDLKNIALEEKKDNNNFDIRKDELNLRREENILKFKVDMEKINNDHLEKDKKLNIEIQQNQFKNAQILAEINNKFVLEKLNQEKNLEKIKIEQEEKQLQREKELKELIKILFKKIKEK